MRTRIALLLAVVWGSLMVSPHPSGAQSTPNQITPGNNTGTQPYETYGGARENINLATGNLNLQIPLFKLPGRDGLDLAIGLEYDSKIWQLHAETDPYYGIFYWWDGESRSYPMTSGWRLMLPSIDSSSGPLRPALHPEYCTTFIVTLSDGSKHSFTNQNDCYHIVTDQNGDHWVYDPQKDVKTGQSKTSAWLMLDTTNLNAPVLKTKDGTRVVFGPLVDGTPTSVSNITDANGNKISFQATSITDTLGRVITINTACPGSISYKDSNGQTRTISWACDSITTISPTFQLPVGANGVAPSTGGLLGTVTLPNNLTYRFQYNNFGELTKIVYPTGGYTRYDYGRFTNYWQFWATPGDTPADFREVTARYVCRSASGTCGSEDATTYTPTVDETMVNNQYMDMRDPLGNRTRYQFALPTYLTKFFSSREILRWIYQGESTLVRTAQTDYNNLDSYGKPTNSSLPIRVTTTLNDVSPALVSKKEWDYDTFVPPGGTTAVSIDNVIQQREYAYGSGAPGAEVRRTVSTWLQTNPINGQDYTSGAIHILDRKASEQVFDPAISLTQPVAQSQFEYDSFTEGLTASGAVQHDSSFGTGYTTRGALTATKHWRNTDGAWLTTRSQYDDAGNIRKTTDPMSHATTFSFADSWGNATCTPTGGNAAAYVTSTTNALNQTASSTYNSCSGTRASATDLNSQTTNFTYDLMSRPTQANLPDGGQSTNTFNESSFPLSVTHTLKITSSLNLVIPPFVDGLGRVTTTRLDSDPQGVTYTDTTYDAVGRKATVSNPYRSTSDSTYGITTYQYDALGRVTKVIPPDGSQSSNNVSTTYSGNCSTVTDQAGKKRKACSDALGRLTQVFEPDAGGNFIYETDSQYDVLNNLLRVDQKGNDSNSANWRTRTFTYNSLSQLLTASNPESGTITYTYDDDGNLLTKRDARNITTTHTDDALHRLTGKTYSNGDPALSYFYDQTSYNGLTITNGKGRRTGMGDAAGVEAWSYDSMGRVLTDRRTTNGVTKTTSYTYNLDGSLATLLYPSGRVITYTPSAAGRLVSAVDTGNSINYALNASYTPHGMLASLQNGASLVATFYFNNRLQPCRVSVKSSGTAPTQCTDTTQTGNMLDFTYNFSLGTADNGNVTSIANNRNHNRDLSYTYDQLNRIATAQSAASSGSDCWGLSFGYDIWANLLSASVTKCNAPMLSVGVTAQNKINNTGFSYDVAGNLTADGSFSYTWDAESRMKSAAGVNYAYDGDDRRVQKSNGKLYWYGGGSDPVAETDVAGNSPVEYIFFGGKRIARRDASGSVSYYFADHLGTARVVTNASGGILDDSDFYPFGGERVVVSSSGNIYKFTGKERDVETGLDYLMARYYSSGFGRFYSPDEFTGGTVGAISPGDPLPPGPLPYADITNPQSLNKYTYGYNNPLRYIDPTGHDPSPDPTEPTKGAAPDTTENTRGDMGCSQNDDKCKSSGPDQQQQQQQGQQQAQHHNEERAAGAVIGGVVGAVVGAAVAGGACTAAAPGVGTVGCGTVGGVEGAQTGAAVGVAVGALGPVAYTKTKEAAEKVGQFLNTALGHLGKLKGPEQDPRKGWKNTVRNSADKMDKVADKMANKTLRNATHFVAHLLRDLAN